MRTPTPGDISVVAADPRRPNGSDAPASRWPYRLALAAVLLVAFALRVWRLADVPPGLHTDEGHYAKDAIAINAPISTMTAAGTSGNSVQVTAQTGAITAAGAINGGFVSLSGAGGVNVSQPLTATSSVNLNASNGTVTVGANLTSTNSSINLQGSNGIKITNDNPDSGPFYELVVTGGLRLDDDIFARYGVGTSAMPPPQPIPGFLNGTVFTRVFTTARELLQQEERLQAAKPPSRLAASSW